MWHGVIMNGVILTWGFFRMEIGAILKWGHSFRMICVCVISILGYFGIRLFWYEVILVKGHFGGVISAG